MIECDEPAGGPRLPEKNAVARPALDLMNNGLRIAHVNYSLQVGGAETVTAELCRRSRDRGHTVQLDCLAGDGPIGAMLRAEGFPIHVHGPAGRLTVSRSLYRSLREFRPDVVHLHNSGATTLGAPVARLAHVPVIISTRHGITHAGETPARLLQFGLASRLCTRIVGVCQAVTDHLRGLRWVPGGRLVTVYNGAAPAPVTAPATPLPQNGFTLVWIGRLSSPKDPATLLRALAQARRERPDLRLWFVGDGELRSSAEALRAELGLGDAVTFWGTRRDVGAILAAADLFVLSSRSEGLPISLLEAMAASKPSLATDAGAMRELIEGGACGLVVPRGDVDAMARALLAIARDPAQCERWSQAARLHYGAHFTPDRMAESYLKLYRECLR
jgi:glycosyltransferase involved in cell wall biosynthesis